MSLISPLVAMLVALGTPHGAAAPVGGEDVARQSDGAGTGTIDLDSLSARHPQWTGFSDGVEIPIANQVQIEQRVILRISPQPSNMRRSMLAELPRQTPATRLVERPYGKCLNAADIIGVSDRGSRLVMYMRDRGIITAQLEKACSPRDFYLGFYVEKNEDGRLCVDRDRLMSRAGAKCRISNFNRLVAVTGDR